MMFYIEKVLDRVIKIPCEVISEAGEETLIALPAAQPFIMAACYQYVKNTDLSAE